MLEQHTVAMKEQLMAAQEQVQAAVKVQEFKAANTCQAPDINLQVLFADVLYIVNKLATNSNNFHT